MTLASPRWLTLALACATAAPAHAQSPGAETLFRDGRRLIRQGKLADGCNKLDASERLEPAVGTLLNVGDCREKLGQLASAWAAFRSAEAMAHRAGNDRKREAEAHRRADKLEGKLTSLEIAVPHPVDGIVVKRDGEVVDAATYGTVLPIDAGDHVITASAPGYVPFRTSIDVDHKHAVVTVPTLAKLIVATPAAAPVARSFAPAPEPPGAPAPPPIAPAPSPSPRIVIVDRPWQSRWTTTREISVGFAIAGVAGLATGAYFGLRSSDLQDRANERCPLVTCADPLGISYNNQARTDARDANIFYVAGGTAAVAALVMWFAGAPSEDAIVTPSVGDHAAALSYAGRF